VNGNGGVALLFTEALRTEASAMGFKSSTAGDGWRLDGTVTEICLELRIAKTSCTSSACRDCLRFTGPAGAAFTREGRGSRSAIIDGWPSGLRSPGERARSSALPAHADAGHVNRIEEDGAVGFDSNNPSPRAGARRCERDVECTGAIGRQRS